jgi:hypothetical protein
MPGGGVRRPTYKTTGGRADTTVAANVAEIAGNLRELNVRGDQLQFGYKRTSTLPLRIRVSNTG